jgi:hypothetical protein
MCSSSVLGYRSFISSMFLFLLFLVLKLHQVLLLPPVEMAATTTLRIQNQIPTNDESWNHTNQIPRKPTLISTFPPGQVAARQRGYGDLGGERRTWANKCMEKVVAWRRVSHKYATLSWATGLDLFGCVVKPKQWLGILVSHFVSSWTGATQQHKFEYRPYVLLFFNKKALGPVLKQR